MIVKTLLVNTFVLVTTVLFVAVVVYELIFDLPDNSCTMTWMYEYPVFLPVDLPKSVTQKFPKYKLFLYGEGAYAQYLANMNGDYQLNGIPVLFVHGNGGKYKQVRSPASVSLRKSESRRYHFNYFSVDYEEELSALYGPFLYRQTQYLHLVLHRIFKCYKHLPTDTRPNTIITIGHSMGGLVLRGAHSLPSCDFGSGMINTIVTLASPHTRPPVTLDQSLFTFYQLINEFWSREAMLSLKNITFLSLGGGIRDFQVHSQLSLLPSQNPNHVSTITTSIPGIWLATDHQCIVWCNELVRAITRGFFHFIDKESGQCTLNTAKRADILSDLFVVKKVKVRKEKLPSDCQEIDLKDVIVKKKLQSSSCFYMKITDLLPNQNVNLFAITSSKEWLFVCDEQQCSPYQTEVFPYQNDKTCNFASINNISMLFVKLNRNDKFAFQKYSPQVHSLALPLFNPSSYSFEFQSTMFLKFSLPSLTEAWQVYEVQFDVSKEKPLLVQVDVPWSNENEMFLINHSNKKIEINLFSEKPNNELLEYVTMKIWCKSLSNINFVVRPIIPNMFARIVQTHVELILRYTILFGLVKSLVCINHFEKTSFLLLPKFHVFFISLSLLVIKTVIRSTKDVNGIASIHLKRTVLPELCCVLFAMLLSNGFHIFYSVLLELLLRIVYPLSWLVNKVMLKIQLFNQAVCVSFVAVLLYYNIPFSLLLILLVVVDIVQINNQPENQQVLFKNILLTVVPSIVVFATVPTIVFIKDMIDGFPHDFSSFTNVIVFTVMYIGYQLLRSRFHSLREDSNVLVAVNYIMLLITFLAMFPEIVVFYNLVYLVVSFLLYVILCYFVF